MVLICKTLNPPSLVETDPCSDSGEEDENVKSLQKTDGQQAIRKVSMLLRDHRIKQNSGQITISANRNMCNITVHNKASTCIMKLFRK